MEEAVRREYARHAERYDERWSYYVAATVRESMRRLDLRAGDRILDVACGTGALLAAIGAERPDTKRFGVDISGAMLEVARAKLGPEAHLCEGRADALPFADGVFDLVVSTNSFHFFPQPEAALAEMGRVLRPGGRLLITDWCDDFLACRVLDRLLRVWSRGHRPIYGSEACARIVEGAGFCDVALDRFKIDWFWGMMTARATRLG